MTNAASDTQMMFSQK